MTELRDVIRRLKLGHGVRDIHRSTGIHRTIVRQLRVVAQQVGWLAADRETDRLLKLALAKEWLRIRIHRGDRGHDGPIPYRGTRELYCRRCTCARGRCGCY